MSELFRVCAKLHRLDVLAPIATYFGRRRSPAAGVKGAPTTVQAFGVRVQKRSAADWEGMLADFLDMEAKSRAGGGAILDADALFRYALRWRIEAASFVRGGGRRG